MGKVKAEKAEQNMQAARMHLLQAEQQLNNARQQLDQAEGEVQSRKVELFRIKTQKSLIESPIIIQDTVVVEQYSRTSTLCIGAGQFDDNLEIIAMPEENSLSEQTRLRVITTIKELVERTCFPIELPENHIVRFATNEFLFYTKRPLSLLEFQTLMYEVQKMASEWPQNLHLILASFAIKIFNEAENEFGVLSVVSYIECGSRPKITFIVKNKPSFSDPLYSLEGTTLTNLSIDIYDLPFDSLKIGEQDCPFSYNNVIKCELNSKAAFYAGINICLDHSKNIANNNMQKLESNLLPHNIYPIQKWLLITSNCISASRGICWEKTTYADRRSSAEQEPGVDPEVKGCNGPHLQQQLIDLPGSQDLLFPQISPYQYRYKIYEQAPCEISATLKKHNQLAYQSALRAVKVAEEKVKKAIYYKSEAEKMLTEAYKRLQNAIKMHDTEKAKEVNKANIRLVLEEKARLAAILEIKPNSKYKSHSWK